MASFQAKKGWKKIRKRKNKNYRSVPTRRVIEDFKKIAKKLKKIKKYHYSHISSKNRLENSQEIVKKFKGLKNTILASFQAKIGLKTMRKRENKNYRSVPFLPDT